MENKKELFINEGEKRTQVTDGKNAVAFERINNDIYGNPLYRVYPVTYSFRRLKNVYKNYESKGYYLVQSYNILDDCSRIIDEVNTLVTLPENWRTDFDYYKALGYTKTTAFR